MVQRIVEVDATINELKKDSQTPVDEKSFLYHFRVKFPQGAGKDLELKENAINTNSGK
jgi:hypothetical protein